MRHAVSDLIEVVYQYYPRGTSRQDARYEQTDEYRRLSAARRKAGAEQEPWRQMLRRLGAQFPADSVMNGSLHLPTGEHDAGYSGQIFLPTGAGEHSRSVGFLISFLVPYYVIYSSRVVDDPESEKLPPALRPRLVFEADTCVALPPDPHAADVDGDAEPTRRRVLGLEFSPEEEPHVRWLARDIEATWGYERMPAEVGKVIVPDVATNLRVLGEATLHDCLFSDNW